jgi:hypothetical protein
VFNASVHSTCAKTDCFVVGYGFCSWYWNQKPWACDGNDGHWSRHRLLHCLIMNFVLAKHVILMAGSELQSYISDFGSSPFVMSRALNFSNLKASLLMLNALR